MKHKKEWRTCDRCGSKIEIKPRSKINFTWIAQYSSIKPTFEDGDIWAEVEKNHTFRLHNHRYDLCPKCRKDFERFMTNENINTRNSTRSG